MTTTTATTASNTSTIMQNYLDQQTKNIAADKAAAASSTSTSTNSASSLGTNFNTFIKILTTQLQHQDPTNTTDPNQFTQELVQFAGVEQQLGTNSNLKSLIDLTTQTKNAAGVSATLNYIGKYVESQANNTLLVQNGKAEIGYVLPTIGKDATITVKDTDGNTVATLDGSTNKGLNYVTWDGKDTDGNQLADGVYSFKLTATNTDDSKQTVTDIRMIGKVTGATSASDGSASLMVGDTLSLSTSAVDAVFDAGNTPVATTTKVSS